MTSELGNLEHITLHVSDVERCVRWYTTSFDCEVLSCEPTFAALRFANVTLNLCLPSQEPSCLGFVRPDAASFGMMAQRRDGRRSLYLADPAGNVVELIEDGV